MMSGYYFASILLILAGLCSGQNDDPTWGVTINGKESLTGPHYVREGDAVTLTCTTKAGSSFLVNKQLRLKFINAKTKEEKMISEQGTFDQNFSDRSDTFAFNFDYDPLVVGTFTIKSVLAEMDGEYRCEVWLNGQENFEEFDKTEIIVANDVEKVNMKIASRTFNRDSPNTNLKLRSNQYQVSCEVSGSNPQPAIHMHIGEDDITSGDLTVLEDPDSSLPRRSFKATMMANLDFKYNLFGKKLSCHGIAELPDSAGFTFQGKTASVTLKGVVDKPQVSCSNNTVITGDRKVELACAVSFEPKIKSISFNVGNKRLYPGNMTDSVEVIKKDLNATHEEVVLKFQQVADEHFDLNIYLDVQGYDGKVYQIPVYLLKDKNGATRTATTFLPLTCLLALLLRVL